MIQGSRSNFVVISSVAASLTENIREIRFWRAPFGFAGLTVPGAMATSPSNKKRHTGLQCTAMSLLKINI